MAEIQCDQRALARRFVESEKERRKFREQTAEDEVKVVDAYRMAELIGNAFDADISDDSNPDRIPLYQVIEKDIEHHCQLLEHPKIVSVLQQFVVNEWRDMATGRSIRVNSGLAQPSRSLAPDEVSIPILPDGEKVIVTRTPTLNSNGVLVLTNRLLPELGSLHGVVHIHPDTARIHLQCDFDGDRLAFEKAKRFPTLTKEIERALLPENRYPEVIKRDKTAYKGTFAQIAIKVMHCHIGPIANDIQRSISLRWEATLLPEQLKESYILQAGQHYKGVLEGYAKGALELPPQYLDCVRRLAGLSKLKELNRQEIEQGLKDFQTIQREIVGELAHELQVAADGPKSSARPNEAVIKGCSQEQLVIGWDRRGDAGTRRRGERNN